METFFSPEKGITSEVRAIEGLGQEFGPLKKAMLGMERRYQALVEEITKATSSTDSRALQGKRFQAESLSFVSLAKMKQWAILPGLQIISET